MPEIPEMEIYRKYLQQWVVGKSITAVTVNRPKTINLSPQEFIDQLISQQITQVERHGKMVVFSLSRGEFLITHMMLDGRLYLQAAEEAGLEKPGQVVISLSDGQQLHFRHMRLGYVHLINQGQLQQILAKLGVEPLSTDFTWEFFRDKLSHRRGMIKPLLINQEFVAGVGNAYSNEALFVAGILPERQVKSLAQQEVQNLFQALPQVLQDGIRFGGYLDEPFASWDQLTGGMNAHFKVYDRAEAPCVRCGNPLQAKKVVGRWAYFCEHCQR